MSEPALRGLARGGTFITLGYAAGTIPAIPLNLVLLKGISVRGMEIRTFMGDYPDEAPATWRSCRRCSPTARSGLTSARDFRLAETAAALRYVAERKVLGKVVIDLD